MNGEKNWYLDFGYFKEATKTTTASNNEQNSIINLLFVTNSVSNRTFNPQHYLSLWNDEMRPKIPGNMIHHHGEMHKFPKLLSTRAGTCTKCKTYYQNWFSTLSHRKTSPALFSPCYCSMYILAKSMYFYSNCQMYHLFFESKNLLWCAACANVNNVSDCTRRTAPKAKCFPSNVYQCVCVLV